MPDSIVHTIDKRDDERVCFSVSEYKGALYLSIRVHFRGDDGEWHPTKKGITLSVEELDAIEAGVAALRAAVEEMPAKRPDRIARYAQARRSA